MNTNNTEKKTDWKRIKSMTTIGVIAAAAVILLAVILSTTVLFKVENFNVVGNKRYTSAQIVEASGLKNGKNMFTSNIGKAEEELVVKLPYIEEAIVKRKLPHTVTVEVKESKEVFALNAGSEWYIVNAAGKIIEILGKEPPENDLVQVFTSKIYNPEIGALINYNDPADTTSKDDKKKDEEPKATPFDEFKKVLKAVNKTELKGKISIYNLINVNDVKMSYDSRIRLDVGETNDLDKKFSLAAGALKNEDSIDPNQKGVMDLTVVQQIHFYPEKNTAKK